jgi:hypothetical protein
MTYLIRNTETRQPIATARSMTEANRKVGELNRAAGSFSRYGWVRAERETLIAFNRKGEAVQVTIPND